MGRARPGAAERGLDHGLLQSAAEPGVVEGEGAALAVLKLEDVDSPAFVGGPDPRAGDVGALGGQRLDDIGEQTVPVASHEGELGRAPFGAVNERGRRALFDGARHQGGVRLGGLVRRAVLAPEAGLGGGIELAHQLTLPAVPDARADGPHIGGGEHEQHPEAIQIADDLGKGGDGGRVGDVPLLGEVGQHQMVLDQPGHEARAGRIQPHPFAGPAGGDGPVFQLAARAALADVVEQKGEVERFLVGDLGEDGVGEGMVVLERAGLDILEDADGLQGVLVDRIGVVAVELGLADDAGELGQEAAEQTRLVHQAERAVGPLAVGQDVNEGAGGFGIASQRRTDAVERAGDGAEGVGVQVQALPVGLPEQLQHAQRMVGQDRRIVDGETPALLHHALDRGGLRPSARQGQEPHQPAGGLGLHGLQLGRHGAGQGSDVARDDEIPAHEPLDGGLVAAA